MRTQFLVVGLLSGIAGVLVGAGCDNITAGQSTESTAPPQLVHAFIQDARWLVAYPNRGSALDLLDNNTPRSCFISCTGDCPMDPVSMSTPDQLDTCINEFLVDQVAPDVHCIPSAPGSKTGTCNDPLKIPDTGVPVPNSDTLIGVDPGMVDPGGGFQIRFVFDKVLDPSIETVSPNGSNTPGATLNYTLMPGIVDIINVDDNNTSLIDPNAGITQTYYDNGGSSKYSADVELVPLGPAIVIKPATPLDAATNYTVKLMNTGGVIKDRAGNAAVGLGGGPLPTEFSFKTEDLTPAAAGAFATDAANGNGFDYPDFTQGPPTIAPNEVIQIAFFEAIKGDSATVKVSSGCGNAKPIAFAQRGGDATMCTKADPGRTPPGVPPILNVVNSDTGDAATATMSVDWPMGDCTLTISVPDINGRSTFTQDYAFTVGGTDVTDPMTDPNINSQFVLPSQCQL